MDWKCSKSASKQYHKPDHSEDGMTESFTKIKYLQTDHKMTSFSSNVLQSVDTVHVCEQSPFFHRSGWGFFFASFQKSF